MDTKRTQQNRAHCIEAAMLAAVALRMHGFSPLIVDLKNTKRFYQESRQHCFGR